MNSLYGDLIGKTHKRNIVTLHIALNLIHWCKNEFSEKLSDLISIQLREVLFGFQCYIVQLS